MTILQPCPNCKGQHALVTYHGKTGKPKLGVFCDKSERIHQETGEIFSVTRFWTVKRDDITPEIMADLPAHYTHAAKRELEKVGQGQLVMLIPKAGEAVERSLPHYMPNDLGYAQKHDDEALAHELRASIDQRVQAQKEIQAQIEVLARKGMAIEAEEMELRRKLKEVYTEPLNFA